MSGWPVGPATASDGAAVERLWRDIEALHAGLLPKLFAPPGAFPLPADGDGVMLVAHNNAGTVCGIRHLRLIDEVPGLRPMRRAAYNAIAVDQRARGQGCGRALVEAGEKTARECGATEAIVTVWAGNVASRALYLGLGYQEVASTLWKELTTQ